MSTHRNTTSTALVYDQAGHVVDGFGLVEADESDPRTRRLIERRRLVRVVQPVPFQEPIRDHDIEDTPEDKPRRGRTRKTQEESS